MGDDIDFDDDEDLEDEDLEDGDEDDEDDEDDDEQDDDEPHRRVARGFLKTGMRELDRVLGGGLARDGVVIFAACPGAGKSTLALQVAAHASQRHPVMYVSGEESAHQIRARAKRLELRKSPTIVATQDADDAIAQVTRMKPTVMVLDSAQTLETTKANGPRGCVSQVRAVTDGFVRIAKRLGIATIIIGQVNKEGGPAGPKSLEHLVDAMLYIEWDGSSRYRTVRTGKNRFGSPDVAVFEMAKRGLLEILGASEVLLADRLDVPGAVVCPIWTGTRVLLVEIQAIVTQALHGVPRREIYGASSERVSRLMGVLQRKGLWDPHDMSLLVNVAGGIPATEPAADLAIAAAIMGALRGQKTPRGVAWAGEIGVGGEVRAIEHLHERAGECASLGFSALRCSTRHEHAIDLRVAVEGIGDITQV